MADWYPLFRYAHLLAFVYWLGADLGVFYAARYAARGGLSSAERHRFLRLALLLDMGPRTALILVVPTGFTLAVGGGWLPADMGLVGFVWAASLAWLVLTWWLHLAEGKSAWIEPWRLIDLGVRFAVIAFFAAGGLAALSGLGPLHSRWLALKALLYAAVVGIGVLLRVLLADWLRGMRLVDSGEDVGLGNRLIEVAARRAERWALLLWLLVAGIALLGVAQPSFR